MTAPQISYTTAGAGIGLMAGSVVPGLGNAVGYGLGALIGAAVDFGIKLFGSGEKKAKKKMWETFFAAVNKRYQNQVFSSCLEEMGSGMLYITTLTGIKPTNPNGSLNLQFDQMLKKKLSTGTCIYNGNCSLTLYTMDQEGNLQASAVLNNDGTVQAYSPNFDLSNGILWKQACHDLTLAAYQAWANDYRDNILFSQEKQKEQAQANRNLITKILINVGLMLLMMGYIVREKYKIEELREYKQRQRFQLPIRPMPPPIRPVQPKPYSYLIPPRQKRKTK